MQKMISGLCLSSFIALVLIGCSPVQPKCGGRDRASSETLQQTLSGVRMPENATLRCENEKFTLTGLIANVQVGQSYGYSIDEDLQHTSALRSLTVNFGAGGMVRLEWPGPYARFGGITTNATGFITMPLEGPNAGITYCLGEGTMLTEYEDAYHLVLTGFATWPGCVTVMPGKVEGCLKGKFFDPAIC